MMSQGHYQRNHKNCQPEQDMFIKIVKNGEDRHWRNQKPWVYGQKPVYFSKIIEKYGYGIRRCGKVGLEM